MGFFDEGVEDKIGDKKCGNYGHEQSGGVNDMMLYANSQNQADDGELNAKDTFLQDVQAELPDVLDVFVGFGKLNGLGKLGEGGVSGQEDE